MGVCSSKSAIDEPKRAVVLNKPERTSDRLITPVAPPSPEQKNGAMAVAAVVLEVGEDAGTHTIEVTARPASSDGSRDSSPMKRKGSIPKEPTSPRLESAKAELAVVELDYVVRHSISGPSGAAGEAAGDAEPSVPPPLGLISTMSSMGNESFVSAQEELSERSSVSTRASRQSRSGSGSASNEGPPVEVSARRSSRDDPAVHVESLRERSFAPELVARWEEEMKFTPAENACMEAFRAQLKEENLLFHWNDNKVTFYKFCQARKFKLEDAMIMFRNHVQWRKANDLDTWLPTPAGLVPKFLAEFTIPELEAVKKCYNFSHHKLDKLGRPVYYDRLGCFDYPGMARASTPERILKYFIWYAEASNQYRFPAASLAVGKCVGKGLYVMDLDGFSLKHFNKETREFIKSFSKMGQDNYPEVIAATYIVNAPWVFKTAWAFAKALIDARTAAKFTILGGPKDYMPKLLEVMDRSQIPTFLGGDDTTCNFFEEKGPWADFFPGGAMGPKQS